MLLFLVGALGCLLSLGVDVPSDAVEIVFDVPDDFALGGTARLKVRVHSTNEFHQASNKIAPANKFEPRCRNDALVCIVTSILCDNGGIITLTISDNGEALHFREAKIKRGPTHTNLFFAGGFRRLSARAPPASG